MEQRIKKEGERRGGGGGRKTNKQVPRFHQGH